MALTLKVDYPHLPDGAELGVVGVLLVNGESHELSEEEEMRIVSNYRRPARDVLESNPYLEVKGTPHYGPSAVSDMFPSDEEISDAPAPVEVEDTKEVTD